MALLSVIRRWHFREERSIREISRVTGLSRNTVRKYLRLGGVEPKFKVPDRPSKLDPFADRLSAWLKSEANKPRKQKRTLKQLHGDLMSLGYDGSYNRVAAFAREWRADRQRELQTSGRGTYVPLTFEPGEAFQFDWSEDWAIIGSERTKLQVAHTKLAYSRAFVVRAYLLQTHEMLFDAHNHAFRVFGGIPRRGIYDNMKTAIDKVGRGKQQSVGSTMLVGRMETALRAAQIAHRWMMDVVARNQPSADTVNEVMIGRSLIAKHAIEVTELAMEVAGGAAFYRANGLERRFRDIQGARYHPMQRSSQEHYAGANALGLPTTAIF